MCTATCGGGKQFRYRKVLVPQIGSGDACPTLTESRPCNVQSCEVRPTIFLVLGSHVWAGVRIGPIAVSVYVNGAWTEEVVFLNRPVGPSEEVTVGAWNPRPSKMRIASYVDDALSFVKVMEDVNGSERVIASYPGNGISIKNNSVEIDLTNGDYSFI